MLNTAILVECLFCESSSCLITENLPFTVSGRGLFGREAAAGGCRAPDEVGMPWLPLKKYLNSFPHQYLYRLRRLLPQNNLAISAKIIYQCLRIMPDRKKCQVFSHTHIKQTRSRMRQLIYFLRAKEINRILEESLKNVV